MPNVLHVGCGSATIANLPSGFQQADWRELRFDINPAYNVDFVGTTTDMKDVPDDSVDALYSAHNIEHVYPHEVPIVLREFRRVIKPDGFMVVTCPDLALVAKHIAEGRLEDPLYNSYSGPISALDIVYGHAASIARGEVYMAHRTGFTGKTLAQHGQRAGFASIVVRRRPNRLDLWMVATKSSVSNEQLSEMMTLYTDP